MMQRCPWSLPAPLTAYLIETAANPSHLELWREPADGVNPAQLLVLPTEVTLAQQREMLLGSVAGSNPATLCDQPLCFEMLIAGLPALLLLPSGIVWGGVLTCLPKQPGARSFAARQRLAYTTDLGHQIWQHGAWAGPALLDSDANENRWRLADWPQASLSRIASPVHRTRGARET